MDTKMKVKKPAGKMGKMVPPGTMAPKRPKAMMPDMEDDGPIPSEIQDQLVTDRNNRAARAFDQRRAAGEDYKKGGKVKKMATGGSVKSSASKRADGCAIRGKTRGKMC